MAVAEEEVREAIQNEARSHQEYFKWAQEKHKKETQELQLQHAAELVSSKSQLREAILELTLQGIEEKSHSKWERLHSAMRQRAEASEQAQETAEETQRVIQAVIDQERARAAELLCTLHLQLDAQHADELSAVREALLSTASEDRNFLKSQCIARCEDLVADRDSRTEAADEAAQAAWEKADSLLVSNEMERANMLLEMERQQETQADIEEALEEAQEALRQGGEEQERQHAVWEAERGELQEAKEAVLRGHHRELEAAQGALKEEVEAKLTARVTAGVETMLRAINAVHLVAETEAPVAMAGCEEQVDVVEARLSQLERRLTEAMNAFEDLDGELLGWRALVAYLPEGEFSTVEGKGAFCKAVEGAVRGYTVSKEAEAEALHERESAVRAMVDAQSSLQGATSQLASHKKEIAAMKEGREMFEAGCMGATVAFVQAAKSHLDGVSALLADLEMRTKWHHATNPNQGLNDLPGKIADVRKAISNAAVALPPMGESPVPQPIALSNRDQSEKDSDAATQEHLKKGADREKMLLERINWLESSTKWLSEDKESQYMDMILHDELQSGC